MSSNNEIVAVLRQALEAFKDFKGYRPDCDEALKSMDQAIARAEHLEAAVAEQHKKQEPVAWFREEDDEKIYYATKAWDDCLPLYTHPYKGQPKRERVVFPTMLRQMWSGGEVQEWLDENVNKEPL